MRILDTEHGPRMVARAIPLTTGEHDVLVPPASHANRNLGRRISGGPRVRSRRRSQIQGVGVGAQVLRDRNTNQRLYYQSNGVGRQFFMPSFLVNLPEDRLESLNPPLQLTSRGHDMYWKT